MLPHFRNDSASAPPGTALATLSAKERHHARVIARELLRLGSSDSIGVRRDARAALSKRQAQRLWNLDAPSADAIFGALEASKFLRRMPNDVYIRADVVVDRGCAMRKLALCSSFAALVIGAVEADGRCEAAKQPGHATAVTRIDARPDVYRHYCATCHGRDAKGKPTGCRGDEGAAARSHGAGAAPERRVSFRRGGVHHSWRHGHYRARLQRHAGARTDFRACDPSDAGVKARISSLVSTSHPFSSA